MLHKIGSKKLTIFVESKLVGLIHEIEVSVLLVGKVELKV